MSLSERIVKTGKKSVKPDIIELKNESDIFVKNKKVEEIIKNSLADDSNIIVVCSRDVDKFIACNYVREFVKEQSVEIINNFEEDLKYSTAQRVIIPNPSLSEIIKIFKYIIEGCKTFVFGLNLKTNIKVLESIKVLILTECPNLNEANVEHIFAMSSSLIINVDRNEDGLFEITGAEKIYYENSELIFETLDIKEKEEQIFDESDSNITTDNEIDNIELADGIEHYNILDDDIKTSNSVKKTENKYKLLKEKIRKKHKTEI